MRFDSKPICESYCALRNWMEVLHCIHWTDLLVAHARLFVLPETKGYRLEELATLFEDRKIVDGIDIHDELGFETVAVEIGGKRCKRIGEY